jgi:hypothetical protein
MKENKTHGIQEVVGSIPISSTIFFNNLPVLTINKIMTLSTCYSQFTIAVKLQITSWTSELIKVTE